MKFEPGWALPNLKEAQKRSHKMSVVEATLFDIPLELKTLGKGKNYYLRTYGCQANERDSETLAGIIEEMGYSHVIDPTKADIILMNTCAIRKNAEDKVFGEIGSLKRLLKTNPNIIFALCGCMPQEEDVVQKIVQTYTHISLVFGTHNLHRLPYLLYEASLGKRVIEVHSKEGEIIEKLPVKRFKNHKAWVNIMYGCDKFCTYCIVPYTRGKERSRHMEDILKEIIQLKEEGYQEITLLGQNVNSYGKDLHMQDGFATLLAASADTAIPRIRFTTSHPWNFSAKMIDVIASYSNIMPFIHLPLQSGDNEILKRMGRRYTIQEYMELFHKLQARIRNCAFSTDIIVGFPNESDAQFQQTLDIVEECQFDNAFTFIYSPRVGTPAATFEDTVPMHEKEERLQILNKTWNSFARAKNEAYRNRIVEVLIDGYSKKNENVMCGYTQTNKLVNFEAHNCFPGDLVNVKITDCKTFSLNGELCEEKQHANLIAK